MTSLHFYLVFFDIIKQNFAFLHHCVSETEATGAPHLKHSSSVLDMDKIQTTSELELHLPKTQKACKIDLMTFFF